MAVKITLTAEPSKMWGMEQLLTETEHLSEAEQKAAIKELILEDVHAFVEECSWQIEILPAIDIKLQERAEDQKFFTYMEMLLQQKARARTTQQTCSNPNCEDCRALME